MGTRKVKSRLKLSRRSLLGLATFGALGIRGRNTFAEDNKVDSAGSSVAFDVPPDACDCHVHVFCEPDRYPFAPDRPYTPPAATVAALAEQLDALHMQRVVIVSPAVYGLSNDCTLAAIRELGSRARGVALIGAQTTPAECERLRNGGIRGVRLNFETFGVTDPEVAIDRFRWVSDIAAEHEWHVQINTRLPIVDALEQSILDGKVEVVFDHFAQTQAALGIEQAGFATLLRLMKAQRAYVKLSAAYRISTLGPRYPDVAPVARALIAANRKRVLWGSDWPHPDAIQKLGRRPTDLRPPLPVDDVQVLNQLAYWEPDPAVRRAILVDNPSRLYGFTLN